MNDKNTEKHQCPVCEESFPLMTKDGMHNFCPTIDTGGGVVNVCINCKVSRVKPKKPKGTWQC
ncbi:MAG: hypothetical protein NT155_04690 [Candidatus Staskawiczbacteria bacterium]|nr:hypothetical protein [Candidatus Staskawiczbacteria bacterium]